MNTSEAFDLVFRSASAWANGTEDANKILAAIERCKEAICLKPMAPLLRDRDELRQAIRDVADAWAHNSGRVFESMGRDNPRAERIDEAIKKADAVWHKADTARPKPDTLLL